MLDNPFSAIIIVVQNGIFDFMPYLDLLLSGQKFSMD